MKLSELSWHPNVHKLTLVILAVHGFVLQYREMLPWSPKVTDLIVLGLTFAALIAKTAQDPPAKPAPETTAA